MVHCTLPIVGDWVCVSVYLLFVALRLSFRYDQMVVRLPSAQGVQYLDNNQLQLGPTGVKTRGERPNTIYADVKSDGASHSTDNDC